MYPAHQPEIENHMIAGNDQPEPSFAQQAETERRVEAAYQKLVAVQPFVFSGQVQEAMQAADQTFYMLLQDACDRGNEALVGKLLMRALRLWRQHDARERVELDMDRNDVPAILRRQA